MGVYIIAEAGVNHNGDVRLARKLIDCAADAGVDAVKFQTFVAEEIVSRNALKADYQAEATGQAESQLDMIKRLELSYDDFIMLRDHCNDVGVTFLSTPFDLASIDFLDSLDMPFWKIPSGEITNLPYLIKIAATGRNIVMSTGMSEIGEIRQAVDVLQKRGAGNITLLHCNTEYPTPMQDVNLNAMLTLKTEFRLPVGYSDHTLGIEIPVAAAALGAAVIEKHFTLDKSMPGPDHKASLEPAELKAMVSAIRHVEQALGSAEKKPSPSETRNINIARKSIIARRDIKKGEIFSEDNITVKRPGNGLSPMRWFDVIGKPAPKDFEEDELIEL